MTICDLAKAKRLKNLLFKIIQTNLMVLIDTILKYRVQFVL